MTNVQWRIMLGRARILATELMQEELPKEFSNELERILKITEDEDYINSTPKIYYEAPKLNLENINNEVKEKYENLLNEAKRFKSSN